MKLLMDNLMESITQVVNLFNVNTKLMGKYKLLFESKNRITDSDGSSIIDAYLIPLNESSRDSVSHSKQQFLHMQILGDMIPENYLGYEYTFVIENTTPTDTGKVDISISKLGWKDKKLSNTLFHLLNTNISQAS